MPYPFLSIDILRPLAIHGLIRVVRFFVNPTNDGVLQNITPVFSLPRQNAVTHHHLENLQFLSSYSALYDFPVIYWDFLFAHTLRLKKYTLRRFGMHFDNHLRQYYQGQISWEHTPDNNSMEPE